MPKVSQFVWRFPEPLAAIWGLLLREGEVREGKNGEGWGKEGSGGERREESGK